MIKARLKYSLITVITILIIVVVCFSWLVTSQSGLQYVVHQVEPYLPKGLSHQGIEGSIIGPVKISAIQYKNDIVVIKIDEMTLNWSVSDLLFAIISIESLQLETLSVTLLTSNDSTSTSVENNKKIQLPNIILPWRMNLNELLINNVLLTQSEQVLHFKQVKLRARTFLDEVNIKYFDIVGDKYTVNINGVINPVASYEHNLKLNWSGITRANTTIKGSGTIQGNVSEVNIKHQVSGAIKFNLTTKITDVLTKVNWHTELNVEKYNPALITTEWPEFKGNLKVKASGDRTTAIVKGITGIQHPKYGVLSSNFELQRLKNNHIKINNITLNSVTNNSKLTVRGDWLLAEQFPGDIALALNWSNLRWPLNSDPVLTSSVGSAWVKGGLDNFKLELAAKQPLTIAPDYLLFASLTGNATDTGLVIKSLALSELQQASASSTFNRIKTGTLNASGKVNWTPNLSWQSEIVLRDINPVRLSKMWPGQIRASLTNSGKVINNKLQVNTEITRLGGQLRDHPISGSGSINWYNNGLDFNALKLFSGKSRIKIGGRLESTFNLTLDIASNNFSELYPGGKGKLHANGFLSGNSTKPYIKMKLNAVNLQIPNYKVSNINANIGLDFFNWKKMDILLSAQGISIADYDLSSVDIHTDNNGLKATVVSPMVTANVVLKGKPSVNGWQGYITQANIISNEYDNWHLKRQAEIVIENRNLEVKLLCFKNTISKICGNVRLAENEIKSSFNLTKIPLKLVNNWLPNGIKLNGHADASANFNFNSKSTAPSHAEIKFTSGYLTYPLLDGQFERWYYRAVNAEMALDSAGLGVNVYITTNNADNVKLDLKLPGLKINSINSHTQKINADFSMSMNDPRIIEAMLPVMQDFKGAFDLSLNAKGTIEQPRINLHAKINNGSFKIPQLGLQIKDIEFKSNNVGLKKITYKLDARSGSGDIQILGNVLLDDKAGWPSAMTITGNAFEVAAIPEANIAISPKIKLISKNKNITISGNVHLPVAKIQAKNFTQASQTSPDVVIGKLDKQQVNNWSVSTKLKVSLGKKVTFKGFGFEGRLDGQLKLQDELGIPTKAVGEILVAKGNYTAYGQNLDVTDGRLLFTGGPLTNPGLDLRAIRKVGEITTGLKIRGSLYFPKVELFSIPTMGQTEALSYLVLGRPLEDNSKDEGNMVSKAVLLLSLSSGNEIVNSLGESLGIDEVSIDSSNAGEQASLVVGRYISPKLYISYGVGLIEAINTFKVRYQISERWQIIGENGEFQGADIFYFFDR